MDVDGAAPRAPALDRAAAQPRPDQREREDEDDRAEETRSHVAFLSIIVVVLRRAARRDASGSAPHTPRARSLALGAALLARALLRAAAALAARLAPLAPLAVLAGPARGGSVAARLPAPAPLLLRRAEQLAIVRQLLLDRRRQL